MGSKIRKALLVNDQESRSSLPVKQLNTLGFYCSFAHSFEEAKARLSGEDFEIVLSRLSINGGAAYELRPLLIGRPTSLFYSLSVQQGCWWIPGVRHGTECTGEPALRQPRPARRPDNIRPTRARSSSSPAQIPELCPGPQTAGSALPQTDRSEPPSSAQQGRQLSREPSAVKRLTGAKVLETHVLTLRM